jgi:polysaccharide pyruvyl transferase WcaK-like protein
VRTSAPWWLWYIRGMVVRLCGRPLLTYALGISIAPASRLAVRRFFAHTRPTISLREPEWQEALQLLGVRSTWLPDPVFTYQPVVSSSPQSSSLPAPLYIGISLRSSYYIDPSQVATIVRWVVSCGATPVLLAQSIHPDDPTRDDISSWHDIVLSLCPHAIICSSLWQTLVFYPQLSGVIGMRLHASILACVHYVPFLPLSYGSKIDALTRIGIYHPSTIPPYHRAMSESSLLHMLDIWWSQRKTQAIDLPHRLATLQEVYASTLPLLLVSWIGKT